MISDKQPLNLKISYFLGLLPKNNSCSISYKGLITISFLLAIYVYNIFFRITKYYIHLRIGERILDFLIHTILTLLNTESIVIASFLHKNDWSMILPTKKTRNPLCLKLILFHFCQTIIEMYIYYTNISPKTVLYLCPAFINISIATFSVLNITFFANEIKDNIVTFKTRLEEDRIKLNAIIRGDINPFLIAKEFARCSRTDRNLHKFVQICHKITAFNKIYGVQILSLVVAVLVLAYESFNIVFKRALVNGEYENNQQIITVKLFKCFYFFVSIYLGKCVFFFHYFYRCALLL